MVESCDYFQVLHIIAPLLFILSYGQAFSKRGFVWSCLAGIVTYQVALFLLPMFLGHARILSPTVYRSAFVLLTLATAVLSLRSIPSMLRCAASIRYSFSWLDLLIVPSFFMAVLTQYFIWVEDWSVGTIAFDSVGYHITRALLWLWHGNFDAWRTANWHQIGLPLGGDAELQSNIFLGCGWLGSCWTGMVDTVGASLTVVLLCSSYGLSTRASCIAGLAFLSFPSVGLRTAEVTTDMAAAFPVLAACALWRHSQSVAKGLFVFVSLVGLGVAAKGYVLFAAIPIGLVLMYRSLGRIFTSRDALLAGVAGVAVAGLFCLLSYGPVYSAFGDFHGGESGVRLSAYGLPKREIATTTVANVLTWVMEPLSVLPDAWAQKIYEVGELKYVYEGLGLSTRWFPNLHPGENRSGVFALVFLPWLLLAAPRGYRIWLGLLLAVLFCSVTSTLALNHSAPRFSLPFLALFAILWGCRAQRSPVLVSLLLLGSCFVSLQYVWIRGEPRWWPHYEPAIEPHRIPAQSIQSETLLMFSRGLALEAYVTGRLGEWRFKQIDCPPEGSYRDWLTLLKKESHWISFNADAPDYRFGPLFWSRLGNVCPLITQDQLKAELQGAGWKYHSNISYVDQMWTVVDDKVIE